MLTKEELDNWNEIFVDFPISEVDLEHPSEVFVTKALLSYLCVLGHKLKVPYSLNGDPVVNKVEKRDFLRRLAIEIDDIVNKTHKSESFSYSDIVRPYGKRVSHVLSVLLKYFHYYKLFRKDLIINRKKRKDSTKEKKPNKMNTVNRKTQDVPENESNQKNAEVMVKCSSETWAQEIHEQNSELKEITDSIASTFTKLMEPESSNTSMERGIPENESHELQGVLNRLQFHIAQRKKLETVMEQNINEHKQCTQNLLKLFDTSQQLKESAQMKLLDDLKRVDSKLEQARRCVSALTNSMEVLELKTELDGSMVSEGSLDSESLKTNQSTTVVKKRYNVTLAERENRSCIQERNDSQYSIKEVQDRSAVIKQKSVSGHTLPDWALVKKGNRAPKYPSTHIKQEDNNSKHSENKDCSRHSKLENISKYSLQHVRSPDFRRKSLSGHTMTERKNQSSDIKQETVAGHILLVQKDQSHHTKRERCSSHSPEEQRNRSLFTQETLSRYSLKKRKDRVLNVQKQSLSGNSPQQSPRINNHGSIVGYSFQQRIAQSAYTKEYCESKQLLHEQKDWTPRIKRDDVRSVSGYSLKNLKEQLPNGKREIISQYSHQQRNDLSLKIKPETVSGYCLQDRMRGSSQMKPNNVSGYSLQDRMRGSQQIKPSNDSGYSLTDRKNKSPQKQNENVFEYLHEDEKNETQQITQKSVSRYSVQGGSNSSSQIKKESGFKISILDPPSLQNKQENDSQKLIQKVNNTQLQSTKESGSKISIQGQKDELLQMEEEGVSKLSFQEEKNGSLQIQQQSFSVPPIQRQNDSSFLSKQRNNSEQSFQEPLDAPFQIKLNTFTEEAMHEGKDTSRQIKHYQMDESPETIHDIRNRKNGSKHDSVSRLDPQRQKGSLQIKHASLSGYALQQQKSLLSLTKQDSDSKQVFEYCQTKQIIDSNVSLQEQEDKHSLHGQRDSSTKMKRKSISSFSL